MNVRQWFRASTCFAATTLSWCAFLLFSASVQGQAPNTPVATASATQTATATITTAGTLSNIYGLTQGATGLDFNVVSPNTDPNACTLTVFYAVNATCTVQYTFTPTHPWMRYGSVSLTDSSGNLLGNVFLAGLGTGPQVSYPLSATTVPGAVGSGFSSPTGIAVDGNGNVYVADTANNAIKELVAVGGIVSSTSTIVTLASGLNAPAGIAVDGAGNVYFADTGNSLVKEIVAVGGVFSTTPQILTLGGNFNHPKGVAVDGSGNVYVADTSNDAIKEILAVNGVIPSSGPTINTLGSGFLAPAGVFVDGSGNVFVADTGNSLVKEIVAAGGAINPLGSGFSSPQGVSVDGSGNVYVADTANSLVREISGATTFTLGTGFTNPNAVALDGNGNVFVTDNGTNPATEMNVQTPPGLSFATTVLGATSTDSPKSFTLLNNGNAALIFSIPTTGNNPSISTNSSISINFSFATSTTTCPQLTPSSSATGSLSAGSTCIDAVNFTPTMAGSPLSGSVTSSDNNLNASASTQTTSLSGIGSPGTPVVTVTATSVPVNTSTVMLAASVSYAGVTPTGSVTFAVNSGTAFAATCTGTSSPLSCTASYDPSSLTAGGYTIQASIATDNNYNSASGSGTLTITKGTPTLTVSSSGTSTVNGQVTFVASITPNSGITPTGTVSFSTMLNGTTTTIAGCSSLSLATGPGSTLIATCATSALLAGANSITATIAADTNFNSASSTAINQTVNQGTPVLTLSPTSGASTVNGQVSYTVTVTPNSGIVPGGSVTFNTALGTAASAPISGCTSLTLGANGAQPFTATCTTTSLLAGSNAITATIAADANFVTATTLSAATQTVAKATPVLTLSQFPASSMVNDLVTFTVAVSPNSGILPGGNVSFSTTVGSGTANAIVGCTTVALVSGAGPNLTASCPTRTLLAGSNVVTAVIVSDANFNAATSNSVTQPVSKATTSLALISSQPTSSTVDQAVTFTATISLPSGNPFTTSPGGTVNFTANSTTISGCNAVAVDSSTHAATCQTSALVAPSDVIVATYSSDPNFVGSTSPQLTQIVNKNTPAISVSSTLPTTAVVNQTVTFTATITPNGASSAGVVPTGNVTFARNGSNICAPVVVTAGTNGTATASCPTTFSSVLSAASIVATYSGDSNISTGNASVSQTVLAGSTTTTVTSATNPSAVNQSVNLTATVTATSSGTASPMSGSVTFTDSLDAANPFCTTTLSFSGGALQPAVCPHVFASSGNHIVTAAFTSTDSNFNNSTTANSVTQVVNAASTTLTVANTATTTPTVDQTATFQATFSSPGQALPQGTATYSDGATAICQNLTVTGGVVPSCAITFLTAGDHFITAAFTSTDTNFGNVTSAQLRQPVSKNTPSVAVASSLPTTAVVNQAVTFTATVTPNPVISSSLAPTGSITFTRGQGGPVLCSSVAVTTGPGSTASASCQAAFASVLSAASIVAAYNGDSNFMTSSGNVSQTVLKGSTTTTVTSATNPSIVNQSVNLTATVTATTPGAASPASGSVTFTDSLDPSNPFCTTTLSFSGGALQPAVCAHVFTLSGNHVVTATLTSTDPNFNNSTTANSVTQLVNAASTTLTVANTATTTPTVNQTATFQATFSSPGQALPQGTATYSDGATPICQNLTVTGGVVPSCIITFLTAGDHFITAAFTSTDTNFQSVSSAQFRQSVNKNTPSVALASSLPTTAVVNQTVTFTATVTPNQVMSSSVAPSGSVTFTRGQGGPVLCSSVTVTTGPGSTAIASCPTAFASVYTTGTTIVATYNGDTNFLSNGGTVSQTVQPGATSTTVTSATNPSAVNQSVTLTATVTPTVSAGPAFPQSGSLTFSDSTDPTNTFCPTTLTVSAGVLQPAICQHIFSSFGPHTVTAAFTSTDANFNGSTIANGLAQTVNAAAITLNVSSSSTPLVNQQATFQATFSPLGQAIPQGMVAYFDGTAMICPNAPVSPTGAAPGCTATFQTAGSHPITAIFTPSDSNFQQALPATPLLLTVSQNTPTVAITSPASTSTPNVGQGQTFTATVTPSTTGSTAPTGNVTFSYSVVTPTATKTGTICTTTALVASGSVGSASCPLPTPLILQGAYTITAQYLGDSNFTVASSAPLRETVIKATTALAVGSPTAPQINVATLFTPSLSITSMLAPSGTGTTLPTGLFTLKDGSAANAPVICSVQVAATGTITCPTYIFPTAGAHTIVATYAGDDNFNGSTATAAMVAIATAAPTITVSSSSPSNTSVATQTVVFTAIVRASPAGSTAPTNPNGNITFSIAQGGSSASFACSPTPPPTTGTTTSTVTATCTVTGFGPKTVGNIAVVATYSGDANYSAVTSSTLTQTVQNFSPAFSVPKLSLAQGFSTATDPFLTPTTPYSYSINPSNGFSDSTSTVCSVVDSSGKSIAGLACATSFTSATSATAIVSAASTVSSGDYTVLLTTTDTVNTALSQTATATVTIINQPASVFSSGALTAVTPATFSIPASLGTPAASTLSCRDSVLAFDSSKQAYVTSTTLTQIGIKCVAFTGPNSGTYSFTIQSITVTSKVDSAPGKMLVAILGVPFLFLAGLYPGVTRHRKSLLRVLGIMLLAGVTMHVTGCGSGGFTRAAQLASEQSGNYLIPIVNAQGAVVAEVPLLIGNGAQ